MAGEQNDGVRKLNDAVGKVLGGAEVTAPDAGHPTSSKSEDDVAAEQGVTVEEHDGEKRAVMRDEG